jgi:hypothetical protein
MPPPPSDASPEGVNTCPGCGEQFPNSFRREEFTASAVDILRSRGYGGLTEDNFGEGTLSDGSIAGEVLRTGRIAPVTALSVRPEPGELTSGSISSRPLTTAAMTGPEIPGDDVIPRHPGDKGPAFLTADEGARTLSARIPPVPESIRVMAGKDRPDPDAQAADEDQMGDTTRKTHRPGVTHD